MDLTRLEQRNKDVWEIPKTGAMRVPGVIYATRGLIEAMDEKVYEQVTNVATLPGILDASYAMPDAHWGYGFPIGGVAAFDPDEGIVSAGGVGFDISCGVRCLLTGLSTQEIRAAQKDLADELFRTIPAGVGSTGNLRLDKTEMDNMLQGGAVWAVERGHGRGEDLERIEEGGQMAGARPGAVSDLAKKRQRREVGTLGSGNHYLEIQRVAHVYDPRLAEAFDLHPDSVVVSIHCGSRGLGHQIGTEFLKRMAIAAKTHHIHLPDRELACAPLRSDIGQEYLGAMRAAINCALANRQVLTHLTRQVFHRFFPNTDLPLLYDVSHNTCKAEEHLIGPHKKQVMVHRKGATRAFPPGHPELPAAIRPFGQPVFIGGSMGTASYVLAGVEGNDRLSFSSACHGAGRRMSRHQARRTWGGRQVVDDLAKRGILIRSPSLRGVAEEAPDAYKDVVEVAEAAERIGLAARVARLEPLICVKG
jgi:tRNA-splicing ligase RtcB